MKLQLQPILLLAAALGAGFSEIQMASAAEDLRTLVRGGCPDESNCCFGKWKVTSPGEVFTQDDGPDKTGAVKLGEEVEAISGRVHSDPGKLKVVYKHKDWRAGQTIGLYSVPDEHGQARIGTADKADTDDLSFAKKSNCAKPSKDCWAVIQSQPKTKWWLKIKLADDRSGWIESSHIATDSECKL